MPPTGSSLPKRSLFPPKRSTPIAFIWYQLNQQPQRRQVLLQSMTLPSPQHRVLGKATTLTYSPDIREEVFSETQRNQGPIGLCVRGYGKCAGITRNTRP